MTWWCPDFDPHHTNDECDRFTYQANGWRIVDKEDAHMDHGMDDTNGRPDCADHGRLAIWMDDEELLDARQTIYTQAGWEWCLDDEEWEEDACRPGNPGREEHVIHPTFPVNPRFDFIAPVALNNGQEVIYNVILGQYEPVRPRPTTTRTAWNT